MKVWLGDQNTSSPVSTLVIGMGFEHRNPEAEVLAVLESIEIAAACPDCGRLSFEVMNGLGDCPYQNIHVRL
ncbi:MAG: hypothetical protein M3Q07_03555 [Pseudobdellovibrionaceae bacterium]|nr:hypothetical protein [Pseudobdellovibrionaceae bacterium]